MIFVKFELASIPFVKRTKRKLSPVPEFPNTTAYPFPVISKLFLLLRIVYDINIKDYKNEDEIFNWQKVSEEISMQIL